MGVNLQIYPGKSENLPLVSTCLLYALVFPYIFLLFDCFKWVLVDSIEKCRIHSVLWQFHIGGVNLKICLWYLHVFSMHWYVLIYSYYLTVSNGCSLTALKSVEFTLCSGSFNGGVNLKIYPGKSDNLHLVSTCLLYVLVFPYIFLLFDCFEWVLIDCIEKCRVHSVLWQFQWGGVNLKIYPGKSENLPLVSTCLLYALVCPYICLLFDCCEWVLIDCIEKCRVHSVLWQFQVGGVNLKIYLGKSENLPLVSTCLLYVLVFPYIFLLFGCFEWVLIDSIEKCRVHSVLWQFHMSLH